MPKEGPAGTEAGQDWLCLQLQHWGTVTALCSLTLKEARRKFHDRDMEGKGLPLPHSYSPFLCA